MNPGEVDDGSTPVRRTARARKVNTRFVGADIDEEYIKLVGRITASNYSELKPEIKEHRSASIEGISEPELNDKQDVNSNVENALKELHLGNKYVTVNVDNLTDANQQFNSVIKVKKVKTCKVSKDSPYLPSGEIRPSVIVHYRSSTESEASDISLGSNKKRKLGFENVLGNSDSLKKKCEEYDVESRLAEVLNMKPIRSDTKIDESILNNSTLKQTIQNSGLNSIEDSVKTKGNLQTSNLDGVLQRDEYKTSCSSTKLEQNPAKIIVASKDDMNLGLFGKKIKIVSLKIPAALQRSNQSFNNNQIVISNLKSLELKIIKKDTGSSKKALSNTITGCKLPSVTDLTSKHSSKKANKDISPSNLFSSDGEDDIPLTKLISKNVLKKVKNCSKDAGTKTKKSVTKNKINIDKGPLTGLKIKKLKLVKVTETKQLKNEITSQDDLPLQLLKDTFAKVKKVKLASNGKSTSATLNEKTVAKKIKKAKNFLKLKAKSNTNKEQLLKKLKKPETSLIKKKTSIGVPKYEFPKNLKKKSMKFRMKFPSVNKKIPTKYNDLTNIVVSVGEKEDDYACVTVDKSKVTPKFASHITSLPDETQKKYTFVEGGIVPGIFQGMVLESDISNPAPKKSKIAKKFRDCIAELDAKALKCDNKEKNKKASKVTDNSNNLTMTDTAIKLHDSTCASSKELTNEHSSKSSDLQGKQSLDNCERLLSSSERPQICSEKVLNTKKGKDFIDVDKKKDYSPSLYEVKNKCGLVTEKGLEKKTEYFSVYKGKQEKSSERHKELNKPIKKSVKLEAAEMNQSKDRSETYFKQEISKNNVTKEKAIKIEDTSDKKKHRSHSSEKRSLDVSPDGKLLKSDKCEDKYEKSQARMEKEERKHFKSNKERKDNYYSTSDIKHDIDIMCNIKEGASKENTPKKSDYSLDIKVEDGLKSSGIKKENLHDNSRAPSTTGTKHPFELSIMFDEKEYSSKKKNKHHSRHRSRDEQISPLKTDSSFETDSKIKSKNVDRKTETIGIAGSSDNKRLKSHHDHKSRSQHNDGSRHKKYERDKHSEKSKYGEHNELKKITDETNVTRAVIKTEGNELISPKIIKLAESLLAPTRVNLNLKIENENSLNTISATKWNLEMVKKEESSGNQNYEIGEKSQKLSKSNEDSIRPKCKSEVLDDEALAKVTKEKSKKHSDILPHISNQTSSKCKEIEKDLHKIKIPPHSEEKSMSDCINILTDEKSIEKTVKIKTEAERSSLSLATSENSVAQTKNDIVITNNKHINEVHNEKEKSISLLNISTSDCSSVKVEKSANKENSKINDYKEKGNSENCFKEGDSENAKNLTNKIDCGKVSIKASKKEDQKKMVTKELCSVVKPNGRVIAKKKCRIKINEKRGKVDFKISTNSLFGKMSSENVSDDFILSAIKNENDLPNKDAIEVADGKLRDTAKYSASNMEILTTHDSFESFDEISSSIVEDHDDLKDQKLESNVQGDLPKLTHINLEKPIAHSNEKFVFTKPKCEKFGKEGNLIVPQLQTLSDGSNNKYESTYQLNDNYDEFTPSECSSKVICSYISTSAAVKESNLETDYIKCNLEQEDEPVDYHHETDIKSKKVTTNDVATVVLQSDNKSKVTKSNDKEKAVASKTRKTPIVPSMLDYLCKSVFLHNGKNGKAKTVPLISKEKLKKVAKKKTPIAKKPEVRSATPTNQGIYNNLLSTIPLPGEDSRTSSTKFESLSDEMILEDNAPFMDFLSVTPERKMEISHSIENQVPSSSIENKGIHSPLRGQLDTSKFVLQDSNAGCESKDEIIITETILTEPLETVKIVSELTPEERLEIENKNKKIVEERMKAFEQLDENLYLVGKVRSQSYKGDRRMICDCTLSKEEIENNETGCGEDCLNKLLMIECGSRCALNERCMNKSFQLRNYANVEVFNAEEKGCGVRACTDIAPGTFIMEYIGEVFDTKEFKRRRKEYGKTSSAHFYFMALNQDRFIDATLKGNISRFINHSCSPNAETQKWTVNGDLRIGFFATTFISANEEINFDYRLERYGREPQKCYCGTPVCRGWLGESPDEKTKEEKEEDRRRELRNKKKRELRSYFGDVDLEYEIEKLNLRGLRNRQDTLNLSRLMVRALESDTRMRLLKMLEAGEEACKRLFLDYHGLKLLWSWMADISSSSSKNIPLKLEILKTLSSLPITNKTQLTESRVLNVVERWSKELSKSALEVGDVKEKLEDSMKPSSSSCDKNELSEDSDTDTPDSKDPSSSDTVSPDDSSVDSSETPINSQSDQIMTDLSSHEANDINLDDDNSSSNSPLDSDSSNELSVGEMAMKLLPTWNNLKEVFKIPRKERLQIMKEHEREVDQEFKKYLNTNKKTDEDRTQAFYDRWRYGVDKDKDKSRKKDRKSDKKKKGKKDKDEEDKNISKEERRERFAMQVAQEDEAARQKKLQEDMWTLHLQRCILLGQDPNFTPIFDPSGQCYWDPGSGSWQPYIGPVGNLPVPASYGPNPGLMGSICLNASINQLFNSGAFYPLPHTPDLDSDGGIKGQGTLSNSALNEELDKLDPPLSIESLKDFQKAANDDSLTSAGVLSMTIILPANWKMASDQLGHLYFYHTKTRYSQWDAPTPDLHEKLMTQYTLTSDSESDSDSDSDSSSNSEEFSSDEDDIEEEVKEEVLVQTSPGGDEKMVKRVKGQRRHSEKLVQARVISPILFEDREAARKERKEAKEKAREEARKERWSSYKSSRNTSKENRDSFESNDPVDCMNVNEEDVLIDPMIQIGKSSRKYKQMSDGKQTTKGKSKERMVTALADNSELARKIKESFKTCMANFIVSVLNPYRKSDCTEGRIINTEDFKYLARKLTHFVMVKELKQLPCVDELDCSESVKHKTKEFVRKYMSKYGTTFKRDPNDTKDYLAL